MSTAPDRNNQKDFNTHIELRVGRLEGAMESLAQDVQQTSRDVKTLTDNISSFREEVIEHLGKASAPRWPLLSGIATLILTVATLVGTIVAMMFSGQGERVTRIENELANYQVIVAEQQRSCGQLDVWKEVVDDKFVSVQEEILLHNRILEEKINNKHPE